MTRYSKYSPLSAGTTTLQLGGDVDYQPNWLDARAALALAREVRDLSTLERETTAGGRTQPRETGWFLRRYAAANGYRVASAAPDPGPLLSAVLASIGAELRWWPNAILVNAYADGNSSVALHADDERNLGPDPTIVSLSLGSPRRFMIKPKCDGPGLDRYTVDLGDGDLLVMRGGMQGSYFHQVPKVTAAGPRLNLTLRRYLR